MINIIDKIKYYTRKKGIPVGLVGVNGWGKKYLLRLAKSKRFNLKVCYDINKKSLDKAVQLVRCKKAKNYLDLLKNFGIQAVFIILPNFLHKKFILEALKFKKAVFVEKPLVNTLPELKEIEKNIKKNQDFLMVGHSFRHNDFSKKIKKIIQDNKIGKICFFEFSRSIKRNYHDWRKNRKKCPGGCFMQLGIHLIDVLHFFFNSKIIDSKSMRRNIINNNVDVFQALLKLENGIQGYLSTSFVNKDNTSINIYGERGRIIFEQNTLFLETKKQKKRIRFKKTDIIKKEIFDFFNYLKKNKKPKTDFFESSKIVKSMNKILHS